MPELPQVQAMADTLAEHFAGRTVVRVELGSLSALKTFDPPLSALAGAVLADAFRRGKYLALRFADTDGMPLCLVIHLSRAGWIHWRASAALRPLRPGKGPVALRMTWDDGSGEQIVLDVTEAGTQKRLALHVVRDVADVEALERLGPDALSVDRGELATILAAAGRRTLKALLRDQSVVAGIGNAYSDEILHTARLSPYAPADALTVEQVDALHAAMGQVLDGALASAMQADLGAMKQEKKAGLRVHGRTGQPCDVCGDLIREVRLSDSSFQYCPTCQTQGKPLADRRMSRLLK
jgi:formamidopyrimidine-DNA glycosylase